MKKSRILLSTFLASAVVLAGCSSKTETSSSSSKTEQKEEKKEEKKNSNEAKLGTPIAFEKEVEITVKTAEWTNERNQFSDKPAKKVLLVTYDVKNLSDKDYPVGTDIKLYVNGKKAESYPVQVKFDSISPNRIAENVTQAFAVNEDGSLELEVQPFMSNNGKKIIKLDLK